MVVIYVLPSGPIGAMSKRLLIVGAARLFAPLDIVEATRIGHKVVVLADHEPDPGYLDGVEALIQVPDLHNQEDVLAKVLSYHRQRPIDGVFTMIWWCPSLAAKVASHLGIPGPDPSVTLLCDDKLAFRRAVADAGLADLSPAFEVPSTRDDLIVAADRLGFPLVIKQTNSAGQHNVFLAHDEITLKQRYEWIRSEARNISGRPVEPGVILEEFIEGKEHSLECLAHCGTVYPVQIFEREKVDHPLFVAIEENIDGGYTYQARSHIVNQVTCLLSTIGVNHGSWHVDFIQKEDGTVRILEMANRHGGGRVHEMIYLTGGFSLFEQAFQVAFGEKPVLERRRNLSASERFLVRPPGLVTAVSVPKLKDKRIYDIHLDVQVGDIIQPLRNAFQRVGQIITYGERLDELRQLNRKIDESIQILISDNCEDSHDY